MLETGEDYPHHVLLVCFQRHLLAVFEQRMPEQMGIETCTFETFNKIFVYLDLDLDSTIFQQIIFLCPQVFMFSSFATI